MTDPARIELIFDATCPGVDAARAHLRDALTLAGEPPVWTEWDRAAPDAPPHARRYASPTVLVDGCDVAGATILDGGDGCRLYREGRAPSAHMILTALTAARR